VPSISVPPPSTDGARPRLVHAGINIPPPPQNVKGEFFFNSSNAVSFSDAFFDYSQFDKGKLKELFGAVSSVVPGNSATTFGFNSARIQVNAKTLLNRFYLDDFVTEREMMGAAGDPHDLLKELLRTVFLDTSFLESQEGDVEERAGLIPTYLVEEGTEREYVTLLQAVEYIVAYTNYGSSSSLVPNGSVMPAPRRAIFNFCGTCANCTDKDIPKPNYDNHGSGKLDSCADYTRSFDNLIEYFSAPRFANDELHFELFNEPHLADIHDPYFRDCLLAVAKKIETKFGKDRVIWPAASWEDHAGVTYDYEMDEENHFPDYDIGWHIYPWTCHGEGPVCTVREYERWVTNESEVPWRRDKQSTIGNNKLSQQVWLTEFGASLDGAANYFDPEEDTSLSPSSDANDLRAIANVLGSQWGASCSMLRGIFWWHGGYFFGDSYTIGKPGQSITGHGGAAFVASIMRSVNSVSCAGCTEYGESGERCEVDRCQKCAVAARPVAEAGDMLSPTAQPQIAPAAARSIADREVAGVFV